MNRFSHSFTLMHTHTSEADWSKLRKVVTGVVRAAREEEILSSPKGRYDCHQIKNHSEIESIQHLKNKCAKHTKCKHK